MSQKNSLTTVSISWRKNHRNHRLLFGKPITFIRLDWRRKLAAFQPGKIFGYERWQRGQYGTTDWRIFILQSTCVGKEVSAVPGVRPGAIILFSAIGKHRAKKALSWLDRIKSNSNPIDFTPEDWRVKGSRFQMGLPPIFDTHP